MTHTIKTQYHVVIPAAGVGQRFNSSTPKQYATLIDKTIIEHSVFPFLMSAEVSTITVALSAEDKIASALPGLTSPRIRFVTGGETRAETVFKALESLADISRPNDWVLVHDAARPCLPHKDLQNMLFILDKNKHEVGYILATPATDTVKQVSGGHVIKTLDRKIIWHALTPQAFPYSVLISALRNAINSGINITDEASAVEFFGKTPAVIHGSRSNIKVTHPEDLDLAIFYISKTFHLNAQGTRNAI